jgi:hypothetical protein
MALRRKDLEGREVVRIGFSLNQKAAHRDASASR